MATTFDRNGIRILREEVTTSSFKKVEKNFSEGSLNVPLGEKVIAALRAAKAAEKAAKKEAKAVQLVAAAKKREALAAASAKNAAKLLKFVRGEIASYIENFEEITEEVYTVDFPVVSERFFVSDEEAMDIMFDILLNFSRKRQTLSVEEFEAQALDRGVSPLLIKVFIRNFSIDGEVCYDINPSDKGERERFHENFMARFSFFLRSEGRKKAALEKGVARPDLAKYYNINPEAFRIVDDFARKLGIDPAEAYDSCGVWGIDPADIASVWYACGVKNHPNFRVWVKRTLQILKEEGRVDYNPVPLPQKGESVRNYKDRLSFEEFLNKWGLRVSRYDYDQNISYVLKIGDRKRLSRLSAFTKYYALTQCVVNVEEVEFPDLGRRRRVRKTILQAIDWGKVAEFTKLGKKQKAAFLPLKMAWSLLFNRRSPAGLGNKDPHPVVLADRVTQKTFRQLMQIVKSESENERGALEANTKAAYHLAVAFRDMQTVKRWVKAVTGENSLSAVKIHDAFVDANAFVKISNREAAAAFLIQFPDFRWQVKHIPAFEAKYGRLPSGRREFESFVAKNKYEKVTDNTVALIAAELGLDQEEFEDYQEFFEETPLKKATMLPEVRVSEGEYTFRKLDDHDKRGPFLGLLTDCCQHLHNAGASCAKAGWRDPESGFYVVEKNGNIVAQSWAWRGKRVELCFDSIEGLGQVNVERIASLYKKAAEILLGKLGITRVTVGDTVYGLTPDIKEILEGETCKAAKMIRKVSYTDADDQWLFAE